MTSRTTCANQPLVFRYMNIVVMSLFALVLTACGGGSGGSESSDDANGAVLSNTDQLSDLQIAQSVYFDKRIPAGFYKEKAQDNAYYVTSHIKNTDLLAVVNRAGVIAYDLSSDDFNEAMTWSEQATSFMSSYKQLVDNSETWLYQQFTRVDPATPEIVYLHRILKASVIDRNGVDDTYKGRITLAGMSTDDVKAIVEYLWTFTINNNYGNAILSSNTEENASEFIHTMQQVKLNMSFDDGCDSIKVYEVSYTVPKASGFIMKAEHVQREILAKRSGDYIEICGGYY